MDWTLSGATTPGQSWPGSDGNEGVLRISQSSCIPGASLSDCLLSHPGHSLGCLNPSAEKQCVYSMAPDDWAMKRIRDQEQKKELKTKNGFLDYIFQNDLRNWQLLELVGIVSVA